MKLAMLGLMESLLLSGLVSILACDFSGDRSLGTVASLDDTRTTSVGANGAAAGANTIDTSASGSTPSRSTNRTITLPVGCHSDKPAECATSQYCAFEDPRCGRDLTSSLGVCRERPLDCPALNEPRVVCGCDGEFYDSLCEANRHGTAATNLGECPRVDCLQSDDCEQLSGGCIDVLGAGSLGVECKDGACTCGGTVTIL